MASFRETERRLLADLAELAGAPLPLAEFFRQVNGLLRPVIGFDAGCWHGADPVTGFLTSTVADGLPAVGFERAARLELWSDDSTRFTSLRASGRLAHGLHLVTGGRPERSVRYRELLHDLAFEDELRINLDLHGGRWGAAALMRAADSGPYGEREVRLAERAARAIAAAMRRYAMPGAGPEAGTVPPAVLVIGPTGRLVTADPSAQALLAALSEEIRRPAGVPTAVVVVAERARANAVAGRAGTPASARLRGPDGVWLSLHASLLDGRPDGSVAVVAQPASPTEVMPLTLLAHRLTDREREVALHTVRGSSTREIALALFLTPATVQDHLKSVFAKTGVRSRRELVALLTAPHAATVGLPPAAVAAGVR
ncbi:helix-turn-helix transcriptional regulator [Streptomyces yaizuensis]|uniref:Helix-turn-helix transcriptional regulator n=1 Tax=Streptomyces yaizuensis TaxID=2989713 RepID=A0ABQ5P3P1_9ACTN|nr:helix-turn-helix transcriptional regulator [Streptomyces sp. YSPA8]GLF96861.1 helix-turn-helix transcriptional regulator [Streptomyces sp. YSPA8]